MFQMIRMAIHSKAGMLISILAGAIIGYFVWATYFWLDLPDWIIRSVINKRSADFLTSLFGSTEASGNALRLIVLFIWSVPGALVFGLIGAAVAARLRQGRILVYSSLIWPIGLSLSSYVLVHSMKLNNYPGVAAMTVRRAEHQETVLVIYSAFLIVLFLSLHIFSRALKHNLSLNGDGGTAATR